jgi:hypothetical protein
MNFFIDKNNYFVNNDFDLCNQDKVIKFLKKLCEDFSELANDSI